jgi:DNA helicase II / ATP-dependent DNA helicase PcrA
VRHKSAVNLAEFLEANGIPVYSPRSNQFFDRDEVRLMIGSLIALFPQFEKVRKWNDDAHLAIWEYYDQECFAPFVEELKKPEHAELKKWILSKGREHLGLVQNTDYAFTGLFYQLLRFPLFSRYLGEDLLDGGLQNSRAMRNLATFSQLLNKFEYLAGISVLSPQYLEKNIRSLFNQYFRYLEDGGINEYEDEAEYAPSGCVSFLTIHQSKGLEFPVVLVGSLYNVPRKAHYELDELLEPYLSRPSFEPLEHTKHFDFMRLYYTAFSRPQNILALTCQEMTGRQATPSKYFRETFDTVPDWRGVDLTQFSLEKVKRANLKREYTFTSHLILFEKCAEQYRFYRELEFAPIRTNPVLFGTLVHQTIEDIHKTVLRGEEHKLSQDRIENWFEANYHYLSKRERVYLAPVVKRIALEHVLRYYRRANGDWSKIRDAEVDVSLVKEEYILKGTIDLIRGKDGTVEIVDFKSEKKPDVNSPSDRVTLDRYRRQLEVYAHIVEARYGLAVSKTHLYYTSEESGNPYISYNLDKKSLETTIKTFDKTVSRIENNDYAIPERPGKICQACDMRHYCDTKNWTFRREA